MRVYHYLSRYVGLRKRLLTLLLVSACVVTLAGPGLAGETASTPPTVAQRAAFLRALEGSWHGEARRTPVGARPYDITFVRHEANVLQGAALPGASTHYWTFYQEGEALQLRFLSTFAGNRQPLFLIGFMAQDGWMVFYASPPDFLEVRVRPYADTVTVHIVLRGKPHVEIYLARPQE